jgi:hypothetical protein
MKNHTYEFERCIRKQKDGGPIGMDLTGTIAKIYMKWWDKQLLLRIERLGLQNKLYERYVDDINKYMKVTEAGLRYVDGALVHTEEAAEEDEGVPADLRTFRLLQQIGNDIHPNIQLEVDVPSNYDDEKLPILDLKVWIEEVETENGKELKIVHKHYTKPMANKYVIRSDAAMSMKNKRTILTQMCLRVLLNNSEYLRMEEKKETVEFFMRRMQASGYNERFRYEVLKSAMDAHEKICQQPSRYKGKEANTPQRRVDRKKENNNWFRTGGYESVMFVPATPNSMLRRSMEEEVRCTNLKIKIVENSGKKVKRLLQRNDPFKAKTCSDNNCFVCTTSGEGSCRKSGVTYDINCEGDCDGDVYNGETHGNTNTRGAEHQSNYQYKRTNSVMWKHCQKKHNGQEQEFSMKVVDYVRGDPTKRQILEATRINQVLEEKRINDKKEWIVGKIPTVAVTDL